MALPYLALIFANVFWAGNFIFSERAIVEMSPLGLTSWRWLIAAPLLVLLALALERARWREQLTHWRFHLVQSLLGIVGFTLFTYAAISFTSPVNAALVQALNPAMILLLGAVVARIAPTAKAIIGIAVSLVGVVVVIVAPGVAASSASTPIGILLMVFAVACWSLYAINGRRHPGAPVSSTAIQAVLAAILLTPIGLATSTLSLDYSPEALRSMLYIAIFPSIFSIVLWNSAVGRIGPVRAGVFLNLLPLFTAVLAVIVGSPLAVGQVVGGVVVVVGVFITTRARPPADPPASPAASAADPPASAAPPRRQT
jgi:drug/metabolite transporter (DMT)-like permease